ncbi:MAG TPA: hypothetical protein VHG52_01940 [Thermomicrobiales bacterium]|nr:hypothetical protein [Thermomicrobiales bacterium]
MMSRTRAALVLFGIAVALAGCDGAGPQTPTAPSTVQPPSQAPVPPSNFPPGVLSDYTLSGVVFEMTATGRAPIEGVSVYCELCGAETHTQTISDSNGFYSFTGVWDAGGHATPIWVRKDGYTDPVGFVTPPNLPGPGWRAVLVQGDTRFDIELVRR